MMSIFEAKCDIAPVYSLSRFFSANQQFCWVLADSFKSLPIINYRRITELWAQADLTKL